MSAHTEGPWTIEDHPTETCRIVGMNTQQVAAVWATDYPDGQANARLIAECPALLELLQSMINPPSEMLAPGAVWQGRARAILRRIEG